MLDIRDKKILSILSEDSRTPISVLAKHLGMNRDTIKYKINRMKKLGIIKKFYAELNTNFFGYHMCNVFMMLDSQNEEKRDEMISKLVNHTNTKQVIEYNDKWDIEWILLAKNVEDFDEIITDITTGYGDVIIEREKLIVVENYPAIQLPYDFYKSLLKHRKRKEFSKIDNVDFKILKLVSQDARMPAIDIAEKIKVSSDTVIKRIKQLYSSKVIIKFTMLIDMGIVSYNWYVLALEMRYYDKKWRSQFREFVKEHPYIMRCSKTMGAWDIILRISTDDPKVFHTTVKEIRKRFSSIIRNYDTWVAYKEHYFENFPEIVSLKDASGFE
ncbi:winged helix-turn-helix transcriptional regulator [Thermoproteota archaeon]